MGAEVPALTDTTQLTFFVPVDATTSSLTGRTRSGVPFVLDGPGRYAFTSAGGLVRTR